MVDLEFRRAVRLGHEADHQRAGERPGLGRVVAEPRDGDPGFLHHLARDRLFQRFAGFDESREGRKHARGPFGLVGQQAYITSRHQNDDGRIGSRMVIDPAIRRGATAHISALVGSGRRAAASAEAMPAVPVAEPARKGKQCRVLAGQNRSHRPEVDELRRTLQLEDRQRIGDGRHIDGKMGGAVHHTQQIRVIFASLQPWSVVHRNRQGVDALARSSDQALRAPDRYQAAGGVGQTFRYPCFVAPQNVDAIDRAAAIDIRFH